MLLCFACSPLSSLLSGVPLIENVFLEIEMERDGTFDVLDIAGRSERKAARGGPHRRAGGAHGVLAAIPRSGGGPSHSWPRVKPDIVNHKSANAKSIWPLWPLDSLFPKKKRGKRAISPVAFAYIIINPKP